MIPTQCIEALERIGIQQALDMLAQITQETIGNPKYILVPERALRAIQMISAKGREDWLMRFLDQDIEDYSIVNRIIGMLGTTGNRKVLPTVQQYYENHQSEKTRYIAFWAIHNIYRATGKVWYNGEEIV
ncbi:MAG: hypothetical protein R2867_32395 [Caldilineaceae bacterium]